MIEKDAMISIMVQKDGRDKSILEKVIRRIWRRGHGSVFSADDFADLGDRAAIDIALGRLVQQGRIRRIARGLYDYPIIDTELGEVSPSIDSITKALSASGRLRLQPSGAYAANLLGLSEQVPMKIVFLTDGPSRKVFVKNREIVLKRTTPRNMAAAGRLGGIVIQALRYLGKDAMTAEMKSRLNAAIPAAQRQEVLKDSISAPAWIRTLVREVLLQEVERK